MLLHTPKNGFFFVIDRQTGKPLAANPIVRTSWADKWDLKTGKPHLTPEGSDYTNGPKVVFPATPGARNWYPAAYDPQRNTYFAHVLDMGNLLFLAGPAADEARSEVPERRRGGDLLARPAGGRAGPAAADPRGDGEDRAVAVGQGQAVLAASCARSIR